MRFKTVLSMFLLLQIVGCSVRTHEERGVSAAELTPQQWASLGKPGPSHKLLQPFVGEWSVITTFWSEPDAQGEVSKGHSKISWILGGRFLQEQFRGEAAGQAFDGIGIMGYDNGARLFKTIWMDSLNTAMTIGSGRYRTDSQLFELSSELYDPLLGRTKTVGTTLRFTSEDSYTVTMEDESPQRKRFKSLEMVYSRKR